MVEKRDSRFSRLPDGRVLDSAPMAKGENILVFVKGAWVTFTGTLGEWRGSKPLTDAEAADLTKPKRVNYRKVAFNHYHASVYCVHCGFGIVEVLEVAHLDGNRKNNAPDNLAILCPTCHKMHDLDIISTETIREMRDRPRVVRWSKRMKDAGRKAAESRRKSAVARKWHLAGIKAARTRKENTLRPSIRLTPSEIESLRADKRNSLKYLQEKTKSQLATKH